MNEKKLHKILIIDDDSQNRLLLRILLKKFGYEILEAENGKDGIQKAINYNPDLILMDIMMPVMDGFSAISKLKTLEETKNIPIIILTALDEEEYLDIDIDDFITKPIDTRELLFKIEKVIKNHKK